MVVMNEARGSHSEDSHFDDIDVLIEQNDDPNKYLRLDCYIDFQQENPFESEKYCRTGVDECCERMPDTLQPFKSWIKTHGGATEDYMDAHKDMLQAGGYLWALCYAFQNHRQVADSKHRYYLALLEDYNVDGIVYKKGWTITKARANAFTTAGC